MSKNTEDITFFAIFVYQEPILREKEVNIFTRKFQLDHLVIQSTTAFSSFGVFSRSLTIFFLGDL